MKQISGNFYEAVLSYDKVDEEGVTKRVKETFVVQAFSCGEAERIALEEVATFCNGEIECVKVGLASYKEIFISEVGDIYYKIRVCFITIDERTEKEKRTNIYHLTNADSIDAARRNVLEAYKGTTIDYVIASISEAKIADIFEKK